MGTMKLHQLVGSYCIETDVFGYIFQKRKELL